MIMYMDFGDYSGDGHCCKERILIDAPTKEHILNAQQFIKDEFGADLFEGMATEYEEPHFSHVVWDCLLYTKYPMERLEDNLDGYNLDGLDSLEEFLRLEPNPYVNIKFVIDAFIWILNWGGARITKLDDSYDIPCINWEWGFETVGYGCFD